MIGRAGKLLAALMALGLVGLGLSGPAFADSGTQIADCGFATLKADMQAGGDYYYAQGQCPSPIAFGSTIDLTGTRATLTSQGDDITLDGGGQVPLFLLDDGASLGLTGLKLSRGSAPLGTSYGGGAIENHGTVTVTNSTLIEDNDGNLRATAPARA